MKTKIEKVKKKAFITGVTGQDGSYLAEFLHEKGYEVHAILRRSSNFSTRRIDHILFNKNFKTYYGDLSDGSNLHSLINKINPHEVYNLGAQSHVAVSFDIPEYTAEVDAISTIKLLEIIRGLKLKTKFYQASSSEMFGGLPGSDPQNEKTPFYPKSPYGVSKVFSYWMTVNYRETYNLFACNGILFNHESPRRGATFVSKKITKGVANIFKNKQSVIYLGNLNAKRDWGHAKDYVIAQWKILQQKNPSDYVISTGKTYTVRKFVELAFKEIGINLQWKGKGLNEVGFDKKTKKIYVKVDKKYFRKSEVELLKGDSSYAKKELNWKPRISFEQLVKIMVKYDLENEDYGGKEIY